MLNGLVSASIRFRGVIVAVALLVAGYGVLVASRSKFDVYPEFTPPQVVVQTEAPGLSPEQVELLVTRPIENALNGVGGVDTIRSQSIQGLSVVTTVFHDGTDIYRARQVVGEVLGQTASGLPEGVSPPTIAPLTSATSMILTIGLTSEQRSGMELRTLADWTLKPRLLAVTGVAKIAIFGGEVRQIQVRYDTARLLAHEISLDDLIAATRKATGRHRVGLHRHGQPARRHSNAEPVTQRRRNRRRRGPPRQPDADRYTANQGCRDGRRRR